MRNFNGYPASAYIGQVFCNAIKLAGIQGACCPLTIPWLIYGAATAKPNIVINVDMSPNNVAKQLIVLRSVYIDNLGSDVPIYIQFPDTGYTIVAQPNSAGWFPCYTNGMQCSIIGLGFFDGDIPSTFVLFTNIGIAPSTDIEIQTAVSLWKASSTISRGTTILNTNLGVPALGDQTAQFNGTANNIVQANNLWGTPLPSGFVYLTDVVFDIFGYNSGGAGAGLAGADFFIESTGVAGILFTFSPRVRLTGVNTVYPIFNVAKITGNIKLDATQTWRLRSANLTGWNSDFSLITSFTINPQ